MVSEARPTSRHGAWREVAAVDFRGDAREFTRTRCGVTWRYDTHLAGFASNGVTREDFVAIMPSMIALAAHAQGPFDLVSDVSRVEVTVDNAAALSASHDQSLALKDPFSHLVRRQAGLVARNWASPFWKAINAAVGAPWETETFFESRELWAWLGVEQALADAVDGLVGEVLSAPDTSDQVLRALTGALRAEPGHGLGEAARSLGMSARTLQRALTAAGSSFAEVRSGVRLARAISLLADPALKIGAIAGAVGFTSTTHFTTWFRCQRGVSPSQYRGARAREC